MAELYLARAQARTERRAVIKRVHPHLASDCEFIEMFRREAAIAATLQHPNVVEVLDVGVFDDQHFFVMEYLHGENLREILRQAGHRGGLGLDQALNIVIGVARGLHHAHELCNPEGVPIHLVHRDVSPANVFVTFAGATKVVDFGIAKALEGSRQTQIGVLKGKIGYMSPEQCRGDPVDRRSDVYGLGILLYETTAQRRLFTAESQYAVMNKIMTGTFERPSEVAADYPPMLESIVLRALSVDPRDRYPSAHAMQLDLERVMGELGHRHRAEVLSTLMHGLFGERPLPDVTVADAAAPTPVPSVEPSRRGWVVPASVASALALGLGWALGASRGDAGDSADLVPPKAEAESREVVEATPEPPSIAPEDPPQAPERMPTNVEPVVDPPASDRGRAAAAAPRRRPAKRTRPRAAADEPASNPPSGPKLFPPAYYERQ
jgi:hypothetical protein